MKTSVIRQRVADFLQQHAPFDLLSQEDLLDLAGSGKVKFHESEEYVFRQGEAKGQFVWTIQQGRVELLEESASGERLRDVLGEGDLLGLDRFTGTGASQYSARTSTDVILYGVDAALFETFVARYPELPRFLSARFSVSGSLGFHRESWLDAEPPPLRFLQARTKRRRNRNEVRGTVSTPLTTRAAVLTMLECRSEQLALTLDRNTGAPVESVLTAADLALFCGYNPAGLIAAIRQADADVEISPLLTLAVRMVKAGIGQPHDVDDCCRVGAAVLSAAIEACTRIVSSELSAAGLAAPAAPHCWILFGGSARGDLPSPELPALAVVYDESHHAFQPVDSLYFAAFAGQVAERFNTFGLTGPGLDWPEGARPSMPVLEWKRFYREILLDPLKCDLYACRSFLDLRAAAGDASVFDDLHRHILDELLAGRKTVIPLLANDTLASLPPLTFYQGLVMSLDGVQSETFDLAQAILSPVADAARVFALHAGHLAPASTLARLAALVRAVPDRELLIREAQEAFRIGLYYQTLAGSSRVEPGKLGKFDQLLLKSAFASVQRFLEFTVSTFVPAI